MELPKITIKYTYNISTLNSSVILEWRRQFQMVSHETYNLNVKWGFCNFLTPKLITLFIDGFTSGMKSQAMTRLPGGSAHIYTGFETLKMKCTQYKICSQATFKNTRASVFPEVGRDGQQFPNGFQEIPGRAKMFAEGCPCPDLTPLEVRGKGTLPWLGLHACAFSEVSCLCLQQLHRLLWRIRNSSRCVRTTGLWIRKLDDSDGLRLTSCYLYQHHNLSTYDSFFEPLVVLNRRLVKPSVKFWSVAQWILVQRRIGDLPNLNEKINSVRPSATPKFWQ